MAEKTPEQLLQECQKENEALTKKGAELEELGNKLQEQLNEQADENDKLIKQVEDLKGSETEQVDEAAPEVDEEAFKKSGYLIKSDLKYNGKTLTPGTRSKLGDLNKKGIQRLLNEKVISK